jgi:hypothetical protein
LAAKLPSSAEEGRAEAGVVMVKEIKSFDQHHPGASRHPSSAEEGSFDQEETHGY